jgi:hypothetical protein
MYLGAPLELSPRSARPWACELLRRRHHAGRRFPRPHRTRHSGAAKPYRLAPAGPAASLSGQGARSARRTGRIARSPLRIEGERHIGCTAPRPACARLSRPPRRAHSAGTAFVHLRLDVDHLAGQQGCFRPAVREVLVHQLEELITRKVHDPLDEHPFCSSIGGRSSGRRPQGSNRVLDFAGALTIFRNLRRAMSMPPVSVRREWGRSASVSCCEIEPVFASPPSRTRHPAIVDQR